MEDRRDGKWETGPGETLEVASEEITGVVTAITAPTATEGDAVTATTTKETMAMVVRLTITMEGDLEEETVATATTEGAAAAAITEETVLEASATTGREPAEVETEEDMRDETERRATVTTVVKQADMAVDMTEATAATMVAATVAEEPAEATEEAAVEDTTEETAVRATVTTQAEPT